MDDFRKSLRLEEKSKYEYKSNEITTRWSKKFNSSTIRIRIWTNKTRENKMFLYWKWRNIWRNFC